MKKILAAFMICVLGLATPTAAFAADAELTANDFILAEVVDETPFGVITDADGSVVEVLAMGRGTYVDSIFTLKRGQSLTTYQYEPHKNFSVGIEMRDDNGNLVTTVGVKTTIELYCCETIGGQPRYLVDIHDWTTSSAMYQRRHEVVADQNMIDAIADDYPYFNGKISVAENAASDLTFRLVIKMDE